MITEVREKLYTLGNSVTGLTGGFYWIEAPQGGSKPYAVASLVANPIERDTASTFETIFFQVNLYGESLTALETVSKSMRDKLEDSELLWTLVTYHVDRIELEFTRDSKFGLVFQITQQYRLELTKL